VQRICALPRDQVGSADWSESGTILFSTGGDTGVIYAVSAAGGDAKQLTTLDTARGESSHHFPQFLPGGHRFLFEIGGDNRVAGTYVASLDQPAERRQVAAGWVRRVYSQGHLLFVRDGTLLAQPFDLRNETPAGEPVAIAPGVATWTVNAGFGWFASSPAGTLAYFSGGGARNQVQLAWFDRKGQQTGTIGVPGNFSQIALSPDERTVALEIANEQGQFDIWTMDVARGVASRVTVTEGDERDPVWSPDGRSLAFIARTPKGADLRRKGLRASDPEIVVADSADEDIPEYWLSDGRALLVTRRNEKDEQTVWALPLAGGAAEPLLTKFRIDEPQVSPDGRWLAYVSRESEQDEVYVEPFRREGERVRVSTAGGGQPKWQRDGRALFFTTPANRLMVAAVRPAGDRVDVSLPTELFAINGLQGTGYDDYSPSADGQRFLVKLPVQEQSSTLHVVTNWTSLVK
jgi:Tol biopolymer transport system component